jgi:hypothetical protein
MAGQQWLSQALRLADLIRDDLLCSEYFFRFQVFPVRFDIPSRHDLSSMTVGRGKIGA